MAASVGKDRGGFLCGITPGLAYPLHPGSEVKWAGVTSKTIHSLYFFINIIRRWRQNQRAWAVSARARHCAVNRYRRSNMSDTTIIEKVPITLTVKHRNNEIPLFIASGAVLIEQREPNRFTYRAENLKTGKSVTLGHRSDKLPETNYREIADRMVRCAASDSWNSDCSDRNKYHTENVKTSSGTKPRHKTNKLPGTNCNKVTDRKAEFTDGNIRATANFKAGKNEKHIRLEDVLNTTFEKILPKYGFTLRDKQIELAREIFASICHLDISLAEAEVGTGKTLAYLVPAVLARRGQVNNGKINTTLPDGSQAPVVVATSSIALQRAIERDYIPALSDILLKNGVINSPLTRVLRKGKGHYLCERRLAHYKSYADAKTKKILEPLDKSEIVDLATAKNLTPYIRKSICVDDRCGPDCPKYNNCRYMRYMSEAKRGGYDFQVCNRATRY